MNIKSTHLLGVMRSIAGTILIMTLVVLMMDGCHRTPEPAPSPIIEENPTPIVEAPSLQTAPTHQVVQSVIPMTHHDCPEVSALKPLEYKVSEEPSEPMPVIPSSVPQATVPAEPMATALPSPAGSVEIVEAVTAHHVDRQQRMPTDVSERFGPADEHVWAFVKVRNRTEPTHIIMVWKHQGRVFSRKTLRVGTSPRWRTWSRISLRGRGPGQWMVEVRSADDQLLKQLPFVIQASSLFVAEG